MSQPETRIIISGGGTGGHIFPAIAIAQELERRLENPAILFVGAQGRMEMEKVPEAGYAIEGLWISGLKRQLSLENLSFPLKVVSSLISARRIIKKFRPCIVIGVGGYASGPTLFAASRLGIPTLIQEQNAFPGITNKILARSVDKICVAHDHMDRFFPAGKIVKTGNPVRKTVIETTGKKKEAEKFFDLPGDKKTVLVIGGSQGARSINRAIAKMLGFFPGNNLQLIWQTGKAFLPYARELTGTYDSKGLTASDFIYRMDLAYAMADIIISRAGAIAIAELCAIGKPVIFIPFPAAAGDHQTKNALALVDKDAALMVRDPAVETELQPALEALLQDEARRNELSRNISGMAITDADSRIVDEAMKIMSK